MTTQQRRYDIDWLRTLAFFILIAYHIGMYYVFEWGWHIKSEHQSIWLQDVMILSNQWRMSLLFFISAMALSLYQLHNPHQGVIGLRSKRLLIPLVLGMLVIVPPQLYVELHEISDYSASYRSFLSDYYNLNTTLAPERHSPLGLLTWNHLWFLPYVFVYSVITVALRPLLVKICQLALLQGASLWSFIAVLVGVMSIIWLNLRREFPVTHDLVNDWYSHAKYFWVFIVGYCLPHLNGVWRALIRRRWYLLAIAIACYAFLIADRHGAWSLLADQFEHNLAVRSFYAIVVTLNHWAWIICLVGLAGAYLRFSNAFLVYANRALLPWYIMHQTLIVVAAAWLKPQSIPVGIEFGMIVAFTLVGCTLTYEIVKRFTIGRWLFGLK
ncbi:acyltransferase family protein [Alteromonas sp. ASW11-36]|uniref:Acyltransferase family protein n=1 Tax=Alteromonas arenosi TaxID=3055817 RepID=A0ABT7SS62_9ALTE|nr:acyltransferase family protein [Alteromonas sp. ASW11-36]MDM7859030.1 acyltransferase family protein [Alteromonas sp. ASW11-36]